MATHGAAGYHSFFMSRGASFVEVLPLGFGAKWANVYYARMLELDKKVRRCFGMEGSGRRDAVRWFRGIGGGVRAGR